MLRVGKRSIWKGVRGIHVVPKSPNGQELSRRGIPKVSSKDGFDLVWSQQQGYVCDKSTLATAGTSSESYLPFHISLKTAKNQHQSHIFNLASAAHNNHLFIENISPVTEEGSASSETNKPSRLSEARLVDSFGHGWDQVKEEMVKSATDNVIGEGWSFLVENSNKESHILTIQNNGTPYYFPRNQSFDMNSAIRPEEYQHTKSVKELVDKASELGKKVDDWTMPSICVNLWDHAYLADYGVQNRAKYVRNVLDNLNWSVVNNRSFTDPVA